MNHIHISRSVSLLLLSFILLTVGCSGDRANSNKIANSKSVGAKVLASDLQVSGAANDQSQPAVAYDTVNNNYLVVWSDYRSGSNTNIYGKICSSTGLGAASPICEPEFPVTTVAGNQDQPKVAFDPTTEKFLVIWSDARNAGTALGTEIAGSVISGQFVSATGQILTRAGAAGTDVFDISTQNLNSFSQSEPDLVFDAPRNKFIAAWLDATNADESHTSPALTGTTCSNSVTVDYIPIPTSDANMIRTIEISPANGALSNTQNTSQLLFLSPFSDTGSAFTASWSVQTKETKPRIVVAPDGSYFTAWSGINQTVTFNMPYTKGSPVAPAITAPCTYGADVFTTSDQDTNVKIKIRKDAGFGLYQDFTFGTKGTNPAVAVDSSTSKLLLVWEEQDPAATAKSIQGQLIDFSNFTNSGNQIAISTGTGDRTSPVAAFEPANSRYLVAWEDARNLSANITGIDIYSQFIDHQGNLSGGNTIVSTSVGNQLAPAMVFGDVDFRDFFLVWKDGRNPADADIFGQLIQYSTQPQLVVTDSAGVPITTSAIDFGSVPTGQSKDITFRIRNDGNSTLNISTGSPTSPQTPFSFLTSPPQTINPGTSYDMTVHFAPLAAGSYANNSIYKTTINSDGGNATIYFTGAAVGVNTLAVSTSSFPDATTNSPYSLTLSGAGGTAPYTWEVTSGALPTGLLLDSTTGIISGTPTVSNTYQFTISLTDGSNPVKTATASFSLKVASLSITTTSLKQWTQGIEYSESPAQTLTASGGTGGYTWAITSGSLPTGLSIPDPTTGAISGVPTVSGNYSFTVKVTDSGGEFTIKPMSISINPKPAIGSTTLPTGNIGVNYSQSLGLNGGTAPIGFSVSSGALPPGLSLDAVTGVISGTPASSGKKSFTIRVIDATGTVVTTDLSITINSALQVTTSSLPLATVSSAYSQTFAAAGGALPYTWSISSGALPPGLSFDVNSGVISGTPTTAGTYDFIVTVTDKDSITASSTLSILVSSSSVLTNATITNGTGTITTINNVSSNSSLLAIASKPSNFNISSALDITINSVSSGGTVTLALDFNSLPTTPVFYKVTNGVWTQLTAGTDYTLVGSKLTFAVTDNGAFDSDSRAGVIRDPLVVGTSVTGGGTTTPTPNGTSTNIAPSSSGGSKSGCFIATAAYGSYLDPHVKVLRSFRDDVLLQSRMGTAFVKFYYKHSPPIADYIAQHESLRMLFRLLLTPVILLVKLGWISPCALFLALAARLYRMRKTGAFLLRYSTNSIE